MAIDIKKCDIKIIVDSRENRWEHIENKFKQKGIDYYVAKSKEGSKCLEVGDYSIIVKTKKGNILDFRNYVAVERKGSLNELAGNFTDDRSKDNQNKNRLIREFERGFEKATRVLLLVEEEEGYNKAINGFFRWDSESFLNPKAFMGMLWARQARYNFNMMFCERKSDSWSMIYNYLYYQAREYLKYLHEDDLEHWDLSQKGKLNNYYYVGGNLDTIYN